MCLLTEKSLKFVNLLTLCHKSVHVITCGASLDIFCSIWDVGLSHKGKEKNIRPFAF